MTDFRTLPLRSIRPHPENPRFDLGDLAELTEDIRNAGLIEPLVVMPGTWGKPRGECRDCGQTVARTTRGVLAEHQAGPLLCPGGSEPAGDDWYLLAGHRRREASIAAGLWEVPCRVVFDVKTAADALEVMLRENTHRRDLTPLEEAFGYQRLFDLGYTPTKIAQRIRRSKKTVDRRMALNRLPDAAKRRLRYGTITLADAEAMLDLDPAQADEVLKSVGTKEFRQEVARRQVADPDDPEMVASRLRDEFLGPFLSGAQKPPVGARDRILREVVAAVAEAWPRKATVRAWCESLGVEDPAQLGTVDPVRALIALAVTVEASTAGTYDLLEALGYEPSPVELDLLAGA